MPEPSKIPLPEVDKRIALEAVDTHGTVNIRTVSAGTLAVMRMHISNESDLYTQHQAAAIAGDLDKLNPSFTIDLNYEELARFCAAMGILQTYKPQNNPANSTAAKRPTSIALG